MAIEAHEWIQNEFEQIEFKNENSVGKREIIIFKHFIPDFHFSNNVSWPSFKKSRFTFPSQALYILDIK